MGGFWVVSLPLLNKRKDATWESLQSLTSASSLSTNSKFEIPELRVGTLDLLMALSDELTKSSQVMEVVVNKIRRQVSDTGGSDSLTVLKVEGMPPDAYLTRFKWDEAKYPTRRPLKETVEKIQEVIGRIDDDLKVKVSEYNTLKSQLGAVARKAGGSLAVRDIAPLVKKQHFVDSENLTTLFVVVSKFAHKDWETAYESICNFIVPRSSKVVAEDNDYVLCNVVMFRRVVDDFKTQARSKGYQVREYSSESSAVEMGEAQLEQLRRDVEQKKSSLEQWCRTAFGEAFSALVHVTAIRIFVESILRYGLPPAFQAAVLRPAEKSEAKLRQVLATTYGDGKAKFWTEEGGAVAGLGAEGDLHPYVSFTINLDS